jgi:outer membrane scaffolding protein for murein synthesis (MipA/OmpV family)
MLHRGTVAAFLFSGIAAGTLLPHAAFALSAGEAQAEPAGVQVAAAEEATAPAAKKKARVAKARKTLPPTAATAEPPLEKAQPLPNGWMLTVKGNVLVSPDFPGAKSYGFIAFPTLSLRSPGEAERFTAPDDGVSLALTGGDQWSVGLVGRYQTGRYTGDDRALTGIQDAKWALEPGLFGEFWALRDTLRLRAEVRYGINGYNGLVANLGVDLVQNIGKFTLSGGPRLALAGGQYMDTYFGVTPADAAANANVTAYNPNGGLKSVGVAAAATYHWNDRWATTVRGGYDLLVGDAADSPIVKSFGSRNQFTFGANASYTFPLGYANP